LNRSENIENIREVLGWALMTRAEERRFGWESYYYWPVSVRRVLERLEAGWGQLIGVIGLQGVGKTSAMYALEDALVEKIKAKAEKRGEAPFNPVVALNWASLEQLIEGEGDPHGSFREYFKDDYELERSSLEQVVDKRGRPTGRYISRHAGFPEVLSASSAAKLAKSRAMMDGLKSAAAILIDTPDYSKTDKRRMSSDLNGIYRLWLRLREANVIANFLVFVQKEMFRDHFFYGKMDVVEIEPLTPEELLEAYKKRFRGVDPFTEEALLLLGKLSRGIFRRFMRYIRLAVEDWRGTGEPCIDVAYVVKAVPIEQVLRDLDLELQEVFPRDAEMRLYAAKVLRLLGEVGELPQGRIVEELDLPGYSVSRLLQKMEAHNYIARKRVNGEKAVTLRLP